MKVTKIPLDKINLKKNYRGSINPHGVEQLMSSIKNDGLIHPLTVVKNGRRFDLIAGYRRHEAVSKLGHYDVDCSIRDKRSIKDRKTRDIINIVENIQRKDIYATDLALICNDLMLKHKMDTKEIAERLSISVQKINECLRLTASIPKEHRNDIVYLSPKGKQSAAQKRGKVPAKLASVLLGFRGRTNIRKKGMDLILKHIKANPNYTAEHLRLCGQLMVQGVTADSALAFSSRLKTYAIGTILIDPKEVARLEKRTGVSLRKLSVDAIYKQLKLKDPRKA